MFASEHDAFDVAVIHDEQPTAGEQQEVDVQLPAAAIRNQDVPEYGGGHCLKGPDQLLAGAINAPATIGPDAGRDDDPEHHAGPCLSYCRTP